MNILKIALIMVISLFLFSCTTKEVNIEKRCAVDSDCVPASCCHANDSVNKDYAPFCNNILCTKECRVGTIDCGYGIIKCVERECKVVLK